MVVQASIQKGFSLLLGEEIAFYASYHRSLDKYAYADR